MGEGARTEAIERFLKKHRRWLTREAAERVDPSLMKRLGATLKFGNDSGDGVWMVIAWTDEGVKHEQRLEPFSKEYLTFIDVADFGNDCDMDFI